MQSQTERFNGHVEAVAEDIRVEEIARAKLPTAYGDFTLVLFQTSPKGDTYRVLLKKPANEELPLVRVHSECATGDTFFSLRCDCGPQLQESMQLVNTHGGAIVYATDHEGRGIGLANKLKAYALQDAGLDTVEANHALGFPEDARDYGIAAAILTALGMTDIKLLTNNPRKAQGLAAYGIKVAETVLLRIAPNGVNNDYLATKRARMGHEL